MPANNALGGARRRPPHSTDTRAKLRAQLTDLFAEVGSAMLRASREHDSPEPQRAIRPLRQAARRILALTGG